MAPDIAGWSWRVLEAARSHILAGDDPPQPATVGPERPVARPRRRLGRLLWPLLLALAGVVFGQAPSSQAQSSVQSLRPDVSVRQVLSTGTAVRSVRLVKDPRDNALYYLKLNGDIYRVDLAAATSTRVYRASDHGASETQGLAIGPNGTMYVVGNESLANAQTRGTVMKGVPGASGQRLWSVLARSAAYPKSNTPFDHSFNGIIVSPDGAHVYVNSGSRTDHGEVQSAGGLHPGTREVGLTACILRLPTSGQDLNLPNDRAALKAAGYVFAEGTRNSFDFAFAPNGDLLAPDNGPARDMSDELNWLRPGLHFGFPWRIGGADNPQQYADYDPASDLLLDDHFGAETIGYYRNDPTFPARPGVSLTEPIPNLGPDADSFRDPQDGRLRDASSLGQTLNTFSAHRSPLGLVFDLAGAMGNGYANAAFILSWTAGDPTGDSVAGPFRDPSQDLLQLTLTKDSAGAYRVRSERIVGGFRNPIDAEIIGNVIYVLEYAGGGGLWEITFPGAPTLTVNKLGTGTGTVTSAPAGINCGTDCTATYDSGTSVTLTASPAAGSSFQGWSGACSGTGATCRLTMDAPKSATATFGPSTAGNELTVTRTGLAGGTVTSTSPSSTPPGIDCGADCRETYASGTRVTLRATAASGTTFVGWGGACSGTSTSCTVTMDAARSVTASFGYQLKVTVKIYGSAAGSVSSSDGKIACPTDCVEVYTASPAAAITLTASPGLNSQFTGWSGACGGTKTSCTVTMSKARGVTANFKPRADLVTTNSDSPDPVQVGQTLTYTITVRNQGPAEALKVELTDKLIDLANPSVPSNCQRSLTGAGWTKATCALGTLASGASVTVTLRGSPTTATTALQNTATVTTSQSYDPSPANASATASTRVNPSSAQVQGGQTPVSRSLETPAEAEPEKRHIHLSMPASGGGLRPGSPELTASTRAALAPG
jgi:hypothetical protein